MAEPMNDAERTQEQTDLEIAKRQMLEHGGHKFFHPACWFCRDEQSAPGV
jgi:hypothetical protein